jgi:flagellar basal body-associated protein FliL
MAKMKSSWLAGLTVGLVTLMATPAFARGISLKDAGIALWIFIIIGAVIVLLQLIPAAILFFSFIGTSSGLLLKKKKAKEEAEEKVVLPGYKPATVEK